jgi:hypothetical protein
VCTENSDSSVLVMQPADQLMRHDVSDPLEGFSNLLREPFRRRGPAREARNFR